MDSNSATFSGWFFASACKPLSTEASFFIADTLAASDIDALNRNSPFQPVFFGYDQDTIDEAGQQALNGNAALMKKYRSWIVTIEGHSDERGTAEYNLALGERRALAARNYLVALGIPADRLRTISYGKEFPFSPATTRARGTRTVARISS